MPRWTNADLLAYQQRQARNQGALQGNQPEQPPVRKDSPKQDGGKAKSDGRSRVVIESHRSRLCDADNLYVKPLVDAMRYQGLIADDSPEHIELIVRQKKVRRAEECTLITISRIDQYKAVLAEVQ